jgi:hypothetical protein
MIAVAPQPPLYPMNTTIPFDPFLLALYAEVHYTFRLGLSLLSSDLPEIIADLPWRVDPPNPLPVLCLIKDAHRYPVHLDEIAITVLSEGTVRHRRTCPMRGVVIAEDFWHHLIEIPRRDLPDGPVRVDIRFSGRRRGGPRRNRTFRFHNDNYRRLSHRPLRTTLAREPLPRLPGWYPGEPHAHSSLTADQAEFGAPPEVTARMARALGLRWMALTDHSYDLDDMPDDPLTNDPRVGKWRRLKGTIDVLNERYDDFTTLLGEEVSCGNARGRNVHLLTYEVPDFIPGSGDSAERWLRTRPTLSIRQVLDRVRQAEGAAYAAHPEESGSPLERLLLRRGVWTTGDSAQSGLHGLQIWNGRRDGSLWRGRDHWIRLLLKGHGLGLLGGNDAHGNFNRFRQLRVPLVAMRESTQQIFGQVRTYLRCPRSPDRTALLEALRGGRAVITDGPLVTFTATNEKRHSADIGECLAGEAFDVEISARSTPEFGALERIDLFLGKIGGRENRIRSYRRGRDFSGRYRAEVSDRIGELKARAYLRVEAESAEGPRTRLAITNPLWFNFIPRAGRGGGYRGEAGDGGAARWRTP